MNVYQIISRKNGKVLGTVESYSRQEAMMFYSNLTSTALGKISAVII
jgi:hypothetical protein